MEQSDVAAADIQSLRQRSIGKAKEWYDPPFSLLYPPGQAPSFHSLARLGTAGRPPPFRKPLTPSPSQTHTGSPVDVPEEDLPFQTFECEVCKLEMRPARGRSEAIFGRPRFSCSRCGAKADAFFDVDDMEDERAVARKERVDKEKASTFDDDYDDGDDLGEFDDDDDVDFDKD